MSNESESISVPVVSADTATVGTLNSTDINNTNSLTTGSLIVNDAIATRGNLDVNGNLSVHGRLNVDGALSFGTVATFKSDEGLYVNGDLEVKGNASFKKNTLIAEETFERVVEGIVSANNIRATNRLFVGDSAFKISATDRTLVADRFTATFANVISDETHAAVGWFETAKISEKLLAEDIQAVKLFAEDFSARSIKATSFVSTTSFGVSNDLTVGGSLNVVGGVTINGANATDGALVVNNLPATFNQGITVNHKSGTLTQTLTVIGTTDTTGETTAETEQNKYAMQVAPGVRSLLQGDVVVRDSELILQNSLEKAEEIHITKVGLTQATDVPSKLILFKSGDGWDVHVHGQISYDAADEAAGAVGRSAEEIKARGATAYVGKAVDITSAKERKRDIASRALALKKAAKDVNIAAITRGFTVGGTGAKYRIDAGGNILAKRAIVESAQVSSITAHEIVAGSLRTGSMVMDNVSAEGTITAGSGASISGESELKGNLYNYANVTHKDTSNVSFIEQSTANFKTGSTLKVEQGAQFIADEDSEVTLQGSVEINMKDLILFDSETGKRYRFKLRDAVVGEDGDDVGDVSMEFSEIDSNAGEDEPVAASTVVSAAKTRRHLTAELEEFQEKLRRI